MAWGSRRQRRIRPSFSLLTRPARSSTRICLAKPGREMENGAASLLTLDTPCANRASTARRTGSARAPKVESRAASEYLTIWFSILARLPSVKPLGLFPGCSGTTCGRRPDLPRRTSFQPLSHATPCGAWRDTLATVANNILANPCLPRHGPAREHQHARDRCGFLWELC